MPTRPLDQRALLLAVVIASLFIAAGFAAAGYFVSQTQLNARLGQNSAQVRGLAERQVQADIAYWNIGYRVATSQREQLAQLYADSEAARDAIVAVLQAGGLSEEEISLGIVNYAFQEYRDNRQQLIDQKHLLNGTVKVQTSQVSRIPEIRAGMNRLIARGIQVDNHAPRYLYTRLNDIKPEMMREATRNARIAAEEFATNAGVQVGNIRNARQGNFEIRDVGESYGDSQTIDKLVRVVTSVNFNLVEG